MRKTLILVMAVSSVAHANFCTRLIGKLKDLQAIDRAYFIQIGLKKEIKRTAKQKIMVKIPIRELMNIHPMENANADKINKRADELRTKEQEILQKGELTADMQNALIPSKTNMSVIKRAKGGYVIFDGNGRFKSIQNVFAAHPDLLVEVELFDTNSNLVQNRLEQILRMRRIK